jgi:hypothetical protein
MSEMSRAEQGSGRRSEIVSRCGTSFSRLTFQKGGSSRNIDCATRPRRHRGGCCDRAPERIQRRDVEQQQHRVRPPNRGACSDLWPATLRRLPAWFLGWSAGGHPTTGGPSPFDGPREGLAEPPNVLIQKRLPALPHSYPLPQSVLDHPPDPPFREPPCSLGIDGPPIRGQAASVASRAASGGSCDGPGGHRRRG